MAHVDRRKNENHFYSEEYQDSQYRDYIPMVYERLFEDDLKSIFNLEKYRETWPTTNKEFFDVIKLFQK
jgi:hypothetical protein